MMPSKMPSLEDRMRLDYKRTTQNPFNFPYYKPSAYFTGTVKPVKEIKGNMTIIPEKEKNKINIASFVHFHVVGLGMFTYSSLSSKLQVPKSTIQHKLGKIPYDEYFDIEIRNKTYTVKKTR